MDERIRELSQAYPLPEGWSPPQVFALDKSVGTLKLYLVGLLTKSPQGVTISASAGELGELPFRRAYFELVERVSIIAAESDNATYAVYDADKTLPRLQTAAEVFPQSGNPTEWSYSKSNGVACGADWQSAITNARRELIERDLILRSWFGQIQPQVIETPEADPLLQLKDLYDVRHVLFNDPSSPSTDVVVAAFIMPKRPTDPLVYGFGCRSTLETAIAAATGECLQRLGFLWEEALADDEPAFACNAAFHQEVFLRPKAQENVRKWLTLDSRNGLTQAPTRQGAAASTKGKRVTDESWTFADLTPKHLKNKLYVVKAFNTERIPLFFGQADPQLLERFGLRPTELGIHPVA